MFNDKAAADAFKELQIAWGERDASRRVEVIRSRDNGRDEDEDEEVVVYASGMFEDGKYADNPNLWAVKMHKSSNNVCRLAYLKDCHVCVGGGFPVASFGDNHLNMQFFDGYVDGSTSTGSHGDEETPGDACSISFCFVPHSTWVSLLIHGWPREEWEQVIQNNDIDGDNLHNFLVDDVAIQYPNATIEFTEIAFVTDSIHGALKRLLPSKRKKEVRADRDNMREAGPDEDLFYFIISTMRERGNDASGTIFLAQTTSVLGSLAAMGVERLEGNEELIMTAIETQESQGVEGLRELVVRFGREEEEEEEEESDELSERFESENDSDEDEE